MTDNETFIMVIPDTYVVPGTPFSRSRPPCSGINDALDVTNCALSKAHASAAALMATLELRDIRISELNTALAYANAEAAELMASLDFSNSQLEEAYRILAHRNESQACAE